MQFLNILACAILFGFSSWAVLSPDFKDGLLLKKGLIVLAVASFASLMSYFTDPEYEVLSTTVLLDCAFAVVCVSMVWRRIHRKLWVRAWKS